MWSESGHQRGQEDIEETIIYVLNHNISSLCGALTWYYFLNGYAKIQNVDWLKACEDWLVDLSKNHTSAGLHMKNGFENFVIDVTLSQMIVIDLSIPIK